MKNQKREWIKATPHPDVMDVSSLPNLYHSLKLSLCVGRIMDAWVGGAIY